MAFHVCACLWAVAAFQRAVGLSEDCAERECGALEDQAEQNSLLALRGKLQEDSQTMSDASEERPLRCTKLGILNLDGYYYPTQPGDVNDRRTWCTIHEHLVDSAGYDCARPDVDEGEFSVRFQVVEGFTFHESEQLNQTKFKKPFKDALRVLLRDPSVCAVTCSVGFCSGFQTIVEKAAKELYLQEEVTLKPMLLGTPALMAAFAKQLTPRGRNGTSINWDLFEDGDRDRVIVLTSFYPTLSSKLDELLKTFGIRKPWCPKGKCSGPAFEKELAAAITEVLRIHQEQGVGSGGLRIVAEVMEALGGVSQDDVAEMARTTARNFVPLGWNIMPGYIPVDVGGGFHNTWLTLRSYQSQFVRAVRRLQAMGKTVRGVIMESTEMPAHANHIRLNFRLPVWDISTLGRCLMKAAPSYIEEHKKVNPQNLDLYVDLFMNEAFKQCMKAWWPDMETMKKEPVRLEPKFGTQADGTLKFFENLDNDTLTMLTCTGGRPGPSKYPIGRRMDLYETGVTTGNGMGVVSPICRETELCSCSATSPAPGPGCPGPCPGAGNCGGGPFGYQMTVPMGEMNYPCGVTGWLCATKEDIPPLLRSPSRFVNPGNGLACPVEHNAMGAFVP